MKPKYQEFFYELLTIQRLVNPGKNLLKKDIGDSVGNNRAITVNQLLRFADSAPKRAKALKKFGRQLGKVYEVLRSDIKQDRKISCKRTDAIDINELVCTYRAIVMNDGKRRQQVGQAISKVG